MSQNDSSAPTTTGTPRRCSRRLSGIRPDLTLEEAQLQVNPSPRRSRKRRDSDTSSVISVQDQLDDTQQSKKIKLDHQVIPEEKEEESEVGTQAEVTAVKEKSSPVKENSSKSLIVPVETDQESASSVQKEQEKSSKTTLDPVKAEQDSSSPVKGQNQESVQKEEEPTKTRAVVASDKENTSPVKDNSSNSVKEPGKTDKKDASSIQKKKVKSSETMTKPIVKGNVQIRGRAPPKGKCKSGRFWKSDRNRFKSVIKVKGTQIKYEQRVKAKLELKKVKEYEQMLKDKAKEEKEALRQRQIQNKKRKEENERKSEIVQVVSYEFYLAIKNLVLGKVYPNLPKKFEDKKYLSRALITSHHFFPDQKPGKNQADEKETIETNCQARYFGEINKGLFSKLSSAKVPCGDFTTGRQIRKL